MPRSLSDYISPNLLQKLTYDFRYERSLKGYLDNFVEVYLDDIVIYLNAVDNYLTHLSKVFDRLNRHGLTYHLKKCKLGAIEISFLGHLIDSKKI